MKQIQQLLQTQFDHLLQFGKLYRVEVSGDLLFSTYLNAFTKEQDPIFRCPETSEHNCNNCRRFVNAYGNIVAINSENEIESIWDFFEDCSDEYKNSIKAMSELCHHSAIKSPFVETLDHILTLAWPRSTRAHYLQLGVFENVKRYTREEAEKYGVVKPNQIVKFSHFALTIPKSYLVCGPIPSIIGEFNTRKTLFQRALELFHVDTLDLAIDLINQDSLLDGKAHLKKVKDFKQALVMYNSIPVNKRDNWIWKQVSILPLDVLCFKNSIIGVFITELSEGKELNAACQDFNKRVDPANYMKAKAPITQKMIDEANKFIQENGYNDSFQRRMATIEDIKAADILHLNSGNGSISPISVLDSIKPTSTKHKRSEFNNVEEVPIEKFMRDILPNVSSVELYLQNTHKKNFVSLTCPIVKESKPIFKWDNNFSWTYNGDLAGVSQIKEEVKKAGGFVDAPFRFSIMWNEDGRDIVDLDAHAIEPGGNEIFFGNYKGRKSRNGGQLDIDMISPHTVGVENIFWDDHFCDGVYRFFIHNYSRHTDWKQVKAEVYINGETFHYLIPKPFINDETIAVVTIKNGECIKTEHSKYLVDSNAVSTEIYGLETNKFHKVNLICLSPNHWNTHIGNKHYFFFLEGAMSPDPIRGFHNENLSSELLQHRKVMEVLGNALKVESTPNQLSGLGFDETIRNELVVRLKGSFNRVIKLKF